MPPIAACSDPALIVVSKSIVGDPLTGSGNVKKVTASDGDAITFALSVKNVGGETIVVDISDDFDPVFTGIDDEEEATPGPSWTRTGPTGTVTTGTGDIVSNDVSLEAGQQVTYLVEAIFSPEACTSLVTNVLTAVLPGDNCCHENEVSDYAQVLNADGPRPKLDPAEGFTAMEVLHYLIENASLTAKVQIADFINGCGTLGDLVTPGGVSGDGPAVEILDAFGVGTGLFGETSVGS